MYEGSWYFVHSFTSFFYSLSGATFAFVLCHHDNAPSHTSLKDQIGPITIRISCSPIIFSRLGPQRLLSVPKLRWLEGKRIISNEEVIAETWAYFKGLDISYYRKDIEMLENRYTELYHPRRQLCWGISITLPKKRLFSLKIPGPFSPYSTL